MFVPEVVRVVVVVLGNVLDRRADAVAAAERAARGRAGRALAGRAVVALETRTGALRDQRTVRGRQAGEHRKVAIERASTYHGSVANALVGTLHVFVSSLRENRVLRVDHVRVPLVCSVWVHGAADDDRSGHTGTWSHGRFRSSLGRI
jgi:hypothetical protein